MSDNPINPENYEDIDLSVDPAAEASSVDIDALEQEFIKNDMRQATKRTAVPAAWLVALAGVAHKVTGWSIDPDLLVLMAPVLGGVVAIAYRAARELERKYPWFGRIVFGSSQVPEYTDVAKIYKGK